MDLNRFHPTQKPIKVYKKIFEYCKIKEGDKILDSHLGSMSSAIACWDMRFDLTGSELDKDYFDAGIKRVEQHKKQLQLF
jgi:site-specific DNA-methyltransferase (adenine-specific)